MTRHRKAEKILGLRARGFEYDGIGRVLGIPEDEAQHIGVQYGAIFVERQGNICPDCEMECARKSGLTLHRRAMHGYQG